MQDRNGSPVVPAKFSAPAQPQMFLQRTFAEQETIYMLR